MGIQVGTIFKWYESDLGVESLERCESDKLGELVDLDVCIGMVLEVNDLPTSDIHPETVRKVRWLQRCDLHAKIDPDGDGPYDVTYIWQIGQLY